MLQCIAKTSFKILDLTMTLSGPGILSTNRMLLNNNTNDGFYDSVYTALIHVDKNRVEYTISCSLVPSKNGDVTIILPHEFRLHVLYGAEFTNLEELEDGFAANEGDDVRLVCSGTGNPDDVTYRWTKVSGVELSNYSLLNIRNASCERDQGFYMCTISNGVGEPKYAVTYLSVKCASLPPQRLLNSVNIANITCYSMDIQWNWNKDIVNRSEDIFIHVEYISAGIWTNGTWKSSESDVKGYNSYRVNSLQPGTDYKLRVYVNGNNGRIWEQIFFATTKCCVKCSDFEENTGSQSDMHNDVTVFEICIMIGAFLIGCLISGVTVHCCMKHSNDENRVKTKKYMTYLPKNKEDTFYQEINKAQYMMSINPVAVDTMPITKRAREIPATESEYLSPQEDHIYECAREVRGTPHS
ncbi:uncharacterized protein LOC117116763 isoform X2 [Anneissia japonica]|uniref:uncharacterized protein LOC117116763 isoform X2 n=1 Tax=Anneissia japonica TaxID=1529436 RepID=UPI0014258321|nr:uncharacterized protein LOC117116763 isoform X2 [Anneissia japonica]